VIILVRENIKEMEINEYAEENKAELDMSLNENPLGPSDKALERVRSISPEQLSRYQHPSEKVKQKVSRFLEVDEERLMLVDGCDGAIEIFAQTFFTEETEVAIPAPSFHRYRVHSRKMDADIRLVPPESGYHPSIDRMKQLNSDFMFLANPQNPSGERFEMGELRELIEDFDGHIVLDEALAHLNQNHTGLVSEKVTVLGSLSKVFGLAGLRAGYIVSDQTEELEKCSSPFKISSVAQEAVSEAVRDKRHLEETRGLIEAELSFLKSGLNQLGLDYSESESMTLIIDLSESEFRGQASELSSRLEDKGVKVVEGSSFAGLDQSSLRISVRDRETNKKFLLLLSEVIGNPIEIKEMKEVN
jgi:histidinol-phosphate/aromatic aminotransferase/cobyric acid decarboxylase-like protein